MIEVPDTIKEAVISYYTGDLSQDQANALLEWVEDHPENLKYFRDMAEIWDCSAGLSTKPLDSTRAFKRTRNKIADRGQRTAPSRVLKLQLSTVYKAAAALALLVSLGVAARFFIKTAPIAQTVAFVETSAPKGSRSLITLPDGTSIWLNADTRLRYPVDYGNTNRNVYLDGEAYFKVAKNKEVPFRVNTSGITVTALGTAFNVKAYPEENIIETTLEEGRVRIDPVLKDQVKKTSRSVILKPNQNAIFRKSMNETAEIDNTHPAKTNEILTEAKQEPIRVAISTVQDVRLYTSWKDPRWIFKNEKLGTLAAKLERRYDVTIRFEEEELRNYAFTGILNEESLEQVLAAICLTAPIHYEIDFKDVRLFEDKGSKNEYQKILTQ